MTLEDTIKLIADKFNLNEADIERLKEIPRAWWVKCAQAVTIATRRGYPIDIRIPGLRKGKLDAKVGLSHSYLIQPTTGKYKHFLRVKIKL